jgi:hypothetical protein
MSHTATPAIKKLGREENNMFGLETLNVLLGLITVYLAFGMACTSVVEAVSAWFGMRSRNLETALSEFLAGDLNQTVTFVKAFYDHPLVQVLSKGREGRPSYIPPEIVGQVVEALVTANGAIESLGEAVNSMPGTPETNRVKGLIRTFVTQAGGDADAFRKAVETHFNAVMDRASGWFKRYAHNVSLIVSAVLVIGANVDTVNIATSLASNPAARTKLVEIAEQRLAGANTFEDQVKAGGRTTVEQAKKQSMEAQAALDRAVSDMEATGLNFGWKGWPALNEIPAKVAGLLVSILAVSLGAPFWFDVLQRFMQVRATGVLPRKTKDEEK